MTAQGIEARRAETGTGSVHESPVGHQADAPKLQHQSGEKGNEPDRLPVGDV